MLKIFFFFAGTVFEAMKNRSSKMKLLKSFHFRLSFFGFLGSILVVNILRFSSFPQTFYPKIYFYISKFLNSISQTLPFSIGDIFYMVLGILGLVWLISVIRILRKKGWKKLELKIAVALYFMMGFYGIFHLFWGFNYYKKSIVENYSTENIQLEELKNVAEFYFMKSVFLREFVPEDEKGVFKSSLERQEVSMELDKAYKKVLKYYPEIEFIRSASPNLKPSLFSTGFSYMGVSGYFVPFTGESQYNSKMPDTKILFTQTHETAHQWGFAPENEANFVGYLLGAESDNVELNYVSNYRAMRSILNRILFEDPVYVQVMLIRYSDGMKRDRNYEQEINEKYSGKGDDAFSAMNEAFLRMNNQEGLESYGRFVELLIGFNRKYTGLK